MLQKQWESIKVAAMNVCPTTHAKWSHVHHQGCTAFAWSITSGIISHIMKALVPLPCFLFSHTPQTFFSQIINYLIPFSLHKFSNTVACSLEVREAFSWPEGHIVWICQICYENLGGGNWMNTWRPPSTYPWATQECSHWLQCEEQSETLFHL